MDTASTERMLINKIKKLRKQDHAIVANILELLSELRKDKISVHHVDLNHADHLDDEFGIWNTEPERKEILINKNLSPARQLLALLKSRDSLKVVGS
ncbi:MAG TPA: hypothetical protein VGK02_01140 [Candidatus Aquicultor sp.]|jgi:hypothetical protein